ncbi:MAG TPA: helix-turn-helix transcriptional regulator [Rhizomicrobium sp.]|nr:helix-turn-helix transcriptional regulator [Rhizomicrobium sp.]
MHPILRLLAYNAKATRLRLGLTVEQVAHRARVSVYVLKQIEAAQSNPGIDTVFRIARALGVHAADLLKPVDKRKRLN